MILDPACGSKMFWFDKNKDGVIFGDIRRENHILCDGRKLNISPDVQMDFCALPFRDETFSMVVFDPPHLNRLGKNSWMAKKYGRLECGWEEKIKTGFSECFRVLRPSGTLIFKWNEIQIPVREILAMVEIPPLFGHRSGKNSNTHWLCFVRPAHAGHAEAGRG
jgi:hypothetical protein